jgi:hypothetical protein
LAPIIGDTLKGAFSVLGTIISVTISGFAKIVTVVTSVVNAVKGFIKLMTDNPITRFFGLSGDNSKSLTVSGSEPSAGGSGDGGFGTGAGTGTTGIISSATGVDIGVYSPAMQAAIIRRDALKAETARLNAARDAAAAARLAATGGLSTATVINQYFNAVVADPEAAARAVVEVLNDSAYRGTGGSSNLVPV